MAYFSTSNGIFYRNLHTSDLSATLIPPSFLIESSLAFRERATGVIHGDISTHPFSHLLSVLSTNWGVLATLKYHWTSELFPNCRSQFYIELAVKTEVLS